MMISYDREVDAIYLRLLDLKPDGVIEVAENCLLGCFRHGPVMIGSLPCLEGFLMAVSATFASDELHRPGHEVLMLVATVGIEKQ